ncbi:alpha/beta hydrolase [Nocardioides alcanivorans]|uniref:alpha/beta hydrolase n=1 Tax=Nocardioides alcanivorans TaxID=2897352 RepID=UPI001F2D9AEA|nr:alpha/beta hydrolase [Nocardioides alcanivorans]
MVSNGLLNRAQTAAKAATARGAVRLPTRVKRMIAGTPVVRAGQTLDLDTQLLLRLQKLSGERGAETRTIPEGRIALEGQSRMVAGEQPIGSSWDTSIAGVPVRVLTPRALVGASEPLPTLLFLHGGGFIYGARHGTHDAVGRFLAEQAGVQVLSVDYRLAPEHSFPAAHDDCLAVFRALVADPEQWQVDTARLAVGGDSAGGNLAAHLALAAAEEGLPLTYQLLIYPMADAAGLSESRRMFDEGFFLTRQFLDLAEQSYLPTEADLKDPRVDILNAEIPAGVCPGHLVTAGFDPLRDEGETYARRLIDAGVELTMERQPGLIHGFANFVGLDCAARTVMLDLTGRLRTALS